MRVIAMGNPEFSTGFGFFFVEDVSAADVLCVKPHQASRFNKIEGKYRSINRKQSEKTTTQIHRLRDLKVVWCKQDHSIITPNLGHNF